MPQPESGGPSASPDPKASSWPPPESSVAVRRRVDWPLILGADAPLPAVQERPAADDLSGILAAFGELMSLDDQDAILRRTVEIAREQIGLLRVGLFLLDDQRDLMLGTWGTDLEGRIGDERHVMYQLGSSDREVFRRASVERIPYTVLENCPIVVQTEHETRVVGRSWVACTPIRSARTDLGMLFNDAGLTGLPVNQEQQARAAVLGSLVGTILDLRRARSAPSMGRALPTGHPMVIKTVHRLAQDPSLAGKQLARELNISHSRLARVFKAEMGMSLVEYRNRLRLERFQKLVDSGSKNLLDAALSAGFGSYSQFHRVFRALHATTPRAYRRLVRHRARPR